MTEPPYTAWFITLTDPAHPDQAVAYAMQASSSGGHRLDDELVAGTIEAVRDLLPPGLTRHERTPFMPPGAVEMWD